MFNKCSPKEARVSLAMKEIRQVSCPRQGNINLIRKKAVCGSKSLTGPCNAATDLIPSRIVEQADDRSGKTLQYDDE